MNFKFVISFILLALISAIVSSPNHQGRHSILDTNELIKMNFAQAQKAIKKSGIVMDKTVLEKLLMHHDARDNVVINHIKMKINSKHIKSAWILKVLSKNPTFDANKALKESIYENNLNLSLLLLQNNPEYLTYALRYALCNRELDMFKEIVEKLAPNYNHPALVDAIELSKKNSKI